MNPPSIHVFPGNLDNHHSLTLKYLRADVPVILPLMLAIGFQSLLSEEF